MTDATRGSVARLGRDGDGLVETAAGETIAVPGALPGDGVVFDGDRPSVDPTSPHRRPPPCPAAARCGGCRLQHASDAFIADWRVRVIRDALARRGIETEIARPIVSPERSRRRVGLVATRTKKSVLLGFHRARSHEVVDVEDCLVARPEIMAAAPALRRLAAWAAPRKRAISLHLTTSIDGLDLVVVGAKDLDSSLRETLTDWVERADGDGAPIARTTWNGDPALMRHPPRQRFGRALVAPPPGAFLQATLEGEAALIAAVRAGVVGAARVVDLFAGCGTFALPMAESAETLAIDADIGAIDALDRAWRDADGLKRVAAVKRDLLRRPLLAQEFKGVDAVVFDPPRVGAEAQAQEIAASGAARVVGVSCNPASFARDAAILVAAGFRLVALTPVDQFRWSTHTELVGRFER